MWKLLISLTLVLCIVTNLESKPVWEKYSPLKFGFSIRESLDVVLMYSDEEWIQLSRDNEAHCYYFHTTNAGKSYNNITKNFDKIIDNINTVQLFLTESKEIILFDKSIYEDKGKMIWFSPDKGETWISDTLPESLKPELYFVRNNSFFIKYRDNVSGMNSIYSYRLENKKIVVELYKKIEPDLYLNNNLIDINDKYESFIVTTEIKGNNPYYYYFYPSIYDEKGILYNIFDYKSSYFPLEYNPQTNENHFVSKVLSINDDIWLMNMKKNGYFLTFDKGKNWEFVEYQDTNSKGVVYKYLKKRPYYMRLERLWNSYFSYSLKESGEEILILEDNGKLESQSHLINKFLIEKDNNYFIVRRLEDEYWLYKLTDSEITNTNDLIVNSERIKISPNPVIDILQVESQLNTPLESLSVFNLLGSKQLEYKSNYFQNNNKLDCTNLNIGSYFIVIKTKKGSNYTSSFIKIK